ncbi:MAG TPA: HAD family hydrolase [Blastocatellia bacterium]|nr:HAD family hydrolase [Blastocatellia bacterium]
MWKTTDKSPAPTDFRMLACDYDRTIADDGVVSSSTSEWLLRLKEEGWKLALVTGRELDDLKAICDPLDFFDIAVVENGAVIYLPHNRAESYLGDSPPPLLFQELEKSGIRFSSGRIIVSASSQSADRIFEIVRKLHLTLNVILNRDSVMILPEGVNKATGLTAGASQFGLDLSQIVAVGDAENDIEFLGVCGLSVAVGNALPGIKAVADLVMTQPSGEGVIELIRDYLLSAQETEPSIQKARWNERPSQ